MEQKQRTTSADHSDLIFGIFGERPPVRIHQPEKLATGASRKKSVCEHESCTRTPSFSKVGTSPKRCGTHRMIGDINVRHRLCIVEGCVDRARFGEHGASATHCERHRVDGSRNVTVRTCVFAGCAVSARYSTNTTKPERCALHKIEGDIITSRETCCVHWCPKRPCFVHKVGDTKHCLEHYNPETDMGILYLMCQESGCVKHASFSETKNRPLRCLKHKRGTDRDVVNTKCEFENCLKRPSFAPEGSKASRCKTHSFEGDVNVSGPRCSQEGCRAIVVRKGKRCRIHV